MESDKIVKIFANLGFKTSKSNLGYIVEMSPEEAFTFSSIVGAKYMFYRNGVTAKGRYETFIHRSVFSNGYLIYSPGLFSRNTAGKLREGNSAKALLEKYPDFFSGNKKILIKDIEAGEYSNIESSVYDEIIGFGLSPSEYVLYKNYLSNNVGESLLEYFCCIYHINQGFLVENQAPWFQQNYKYNGKAHQGGIPDFSAFHSDVSKELFKANIINANKGIFIGILPVISLFRKDLFSSDKSLIPDYTHSLLIGEAKTSKGSLPQALKQLEKYDDVDIADELFTILPDSDSNEKYGSFYINDSFSLKMNHRTHEKVFDERKEQDSQWIDLYVRMLMLGNVPFAKVIDFINDYRSKHSLQVLSEYESPHLLDAVQNTDNESLFNFIKDNYGIYE